MADYYPLIARAVAGLDKNTGENRRALYERARSALVNQLRGVEPALDESDITRERLALEDAIRRLEAEAAKRVRAEAAPDQHGQEAQEAESDRHSLRDQGLRSFRDTVAEAEGLGGAAAQANRSAHAAYDDVQEFEAETDIETEADVAPAPHDRAGHGHAQDHAHRHDEHGHAAADEHEERYFEPPAQEQGEERGGDHGEAGYHPDHDLPHAAEPDHAETSHVDEQVAGAHGNADELPEPDHQGDWPPPSGAHSDEDSYTRPPRDYSRLIKVAALALVVIGVAAAGYWQRGAIMSTVNTTIASLTSEPTPPPPPKPTGEPTSQPKIADRIGADNNGPASSATAPAAAVAQKVVLYDEDPSDPKGKRYVGSAVWRTETVSPGPGLAPELAIRADVEIPERRMRMTWSLRRNTDKALPASHTIEIMFTLPADFAEGGIANVPGVLMKQNEQARGVPLAGLAVKVTNGYFLIGLSAVGVDLQRNIQLLKERDWFDIPIVYTSGKRAILAVEKGAPGARAFAEAFRAWGQ